MESQGISGGEGLEPRRYEGTKNACRLERGARIRFVVLHHTGYGEAHFDLMIEVAGMEKLLTWRLKTWGGEYSEAERIGDHRKAYLTYEGPVSGNRGEVKRVADGVAEVLEVAADYVRLRVDSREMRLPL